MDKKGWCQCKKTRIYPPTELKGRKKRSSLRGDSKNRRGNPAYKACLRSDIVPVINIQKQRVFEDGAYPQKDLCILLFFVVQRFLFFL